MCLVRMALWFFDLGGTGNSNDPFQVRPFLAQFLHKKYGFGVKKRGFGAKKYHFFEKALPFLCERPIFLGVCEIPGEWGTLSSSWSFEYSPLPIGTGDCTWAGVWDYVTGRYKPKADIFEEAEERCHCGLRRWRILGAFKHRETSSVKVLEELVPFRAVLKWHETHRPLDTQQLFHGNARVVAYP